MGIKDSKLGNQAFGLAQKLGKAILLPIAILPVTGLFLGIASALTNGAVVKAYPVLASPTLQAFLKILNAIGNSVFAALPLIFAVGIAVGLAKADKGTAGLAAVVGYFVLITTINALLAVTNQLPGQGVDPRSLGQGAQFGIMTLQMGVFGGVLAGIYTAWVHNNFYKLKLPEYLAFFGGSRSVPIITTIVGGVFGVIMFFVWPAIGNAIAAFGTFASHLGIFGAFIYGLVLRTLYIFGLHHVFYLPFWTTAAGGTAIVAGKTVQGWQNIFLAQLADPNTTHFFRNIALYNSGRYIHMLFTLPAICLAMYHSISDKKKRKQTSGFIISIALTSFITGVTEPISFALLFANPILFAGEAILFALSFLATAIVGVTIGSTFSAGLIEYLLFGVFQGNSKTGFIWIIILGIPFAIVTYFLYKFLIIKLNAKTPGREGDNEDDEMSIKSSYQSGQAKDIIAALGGMNNINDIDNCATRLRVNVKKIAEVNIDALKKTGAHNTIIRGNNVQVIYGPAVNLIRVEIDEYINSLS
ncbi:MAG TPA: PTS transporter subunit EIIC [Thermoanaerobacterales bacterium]|nr:PTS transporter subunit EIIC [Thermoanaerobacterales bacterium]